jgi:hypothetical protein
MTKEVKGSPAGRGMIGLAAAVLAAVVVLAFYLWPTRRAPSAPVVDQPAVADVEARRSYPDNVASAMAALPDPPSSLPAGSDVPVAAADGAGSTLCGGKVCKEDQFCCGPPACGYCASKMAGPACPTKCP